jgi:hypothetical protein
MVEAACSRERRRISHSVSSLVRSRGNVAKPSIKLNPEKSGRPLPSCSCAGGCIWPTQINALKTNNRIPGRRDSFNSFKNTCRDDLNYLIFDEVTVKGQGVREQTAWHHTSRKGGSEKDFVSIGVGRVGAGKSGRPCVSREIRELIRQMSTANPLWGAPRIHGELLKLGIQISQATVAKYMVRQRKPPVTNVAHFS